jgi:ATP-dependent RNA helicase DDX51/DBP6
MKLEKLFPVQERLIPIIQNKNKNQSIYPNDLCILAPTGSGKTLTYVLPIIEQLKHRIKPCCRAIVLLPVSDLAEQVYNVFRSQLNEASENLSLIAQSNAYTNENSSANLKVLLLSNKHQFGKEQSQLVNEQGKCFIDILVTTPGRLVDHLQKTKGNIFLILKSNNVLKNI